MIQVLAALGVFGIVALVPASDARAATPLCAPGHVSLSGYEPCVACPAGWHAPFEGMTECLPCNGGHYSTEPGSVACSTCEPGAVTGGVYAATSCAPCEPGSFQGEAGAAFCEPCSIGTYAAESAATACTPCEPGRYQPDPGAVACLDCAAGTYSDLAGASLCQPCGVGTVQPASGSPSCDACPAGSQQPYLAATECEPCPPGTHATEPGAEYCAACLCDDQIACTRDACEAVSGACSAQPVAGCEVATIAFDGSVVSVHPDLAACFEIGESFSGSFEVDPEAPDLAPGAPSYGLYRGIEAFSVQVGAGASARTFLGVDPSGVTVNNDDFQRDAVHFSTSLDGPILECGVPTAVSIGFADFDQSTISDGSLLWQVDRLLAFPSRGASLQFEGPDDEPPIWVEAEIATLTPEAGPMLGAVAATAAIAAIRTRRR